MTILSFAGLYYASVLVILVLVGAHRLIYELSIGRRRKQTIRDHGCLPPRQYPHKGVLGRLFGYDLIKDMIQSARARSFLEDSRRRNFPQGVYTVKCRLLTQNLIITIEPENIKAMLSTNFNDWSLGQRRGNIVRPFLGGGIFTNDGPAWEHSRALVRPNFTRQQVADLDLLEEYVINLINAIPTDGSTVDLQPLFFALTMDSATEFLFGKSTNSLIPGKNPQTHQFVEAFSYVTEALSKAFISGGLSQMIPDQEFKRSAAVVHAFADGIISDAIQEKRRNSSDHAAGAKKARYVFLQALLEQTQNPQVIRAELLNLLIAGRDTTAGLLTNTWHVLVRRQDIWTKLKDEISQLHGKRPNYAEIKELKYLRYVLSESLRLMPIIPDNMREATCDTVLPRGGGVDGSAPILIAKGATVMYSAWSMHRREDFYGRDSLEFIPERWEKIRPGWEYLPFNGGPRICLGQQYALLEASYATVRLIQAFQRIENRDPEPWTERLKVTLSSYYGCKVALFEQ